MSKNIPIPSPRYRRSDRFLVRLPNTPEGQAEFLRRRRKFEPEETYRSEGMVRKTCLKKVYRAKGKYRWPDGTSDGHCLKAIATHFDVYVWERTRWLR